MQQVQLRMLDLFETRASVVDMLLDGKIRAQQTPAKVESYSYTLSWNALAPSANQPVNKAVDGNSDFVCFYLLSQWFNDTTDNPIDQPRARLQLTDNTTQRPIFSDPTFVGAVTGKNGFPYLEQDAKLYPANTIIQATLYNDMAVSAVTLTGQVILGGLRVFYEGNN